MWCTGQDPHPHHVAPGPGPHPTCAGDRTQSPLLGVLDDDEDEANDDNNSFRPLLGPIKHCCSPVYSGHVCVCTRLDMATVREQGGKGSSDKPCPTGVDHHCAPAFGLASGPPAALE